MTDLDDQLLPEVLAVIAEVGISATWDSRTLTPNSSGTPSETNVLTACTISPPVAYSQFLIETGVVEAGTLQVYIAGKDLAFTPKRGDSLRVTGHPARTVNLANPIYSGESIAAWEIGLRE